jgi:hypothetical protein
MKLKDIMSCFLLRIKNFLSYIKDSWSSNYSLKSFLCSISFLGVDSARNEKDRRGSSRDTLLVQFQ